LHGGHRCSLVILEEVATGVGENYGYDCCWPGVASGLLKVGDVKAGGDLVPQPEKQVTNSLSSSLRRLLPAAASTALIASQ